MGKGEITWQCPVCLDVRYETVRSEKVLKEGGGFVFVGKQHSCKGCSVLFRDPYLFNNVRLQNYFTTQDDRAIKE